MHRPLPFGVAFRFRWGGFALPSVAIETTCAVLVGALYTLVPAGPWRRRGCWAAAVVVAVIALARMRLGVNAPTDVLLGAALAVTVPLLALRLLAPDRWYKLGRQLLYGRLEDEQSFKGVRRLLPRRPVPVRVQRWSARRVGLRIALILAVILLGLGLPRLLVRNATQTTTLLVASMNCRSLAPLLAEAQSVPSASEVTCIRALPAGWTLGRVQARRGTSVITLDNLLAGSGSLRLTLAARCDARQAMPERSPGPGIARFRAPDPSAGFAATWYDVFRGGCVTIAFRPATKAAVGRGLLPRQVPAIVGYVSRARLQHQLALRSGGRLRLGPSR